MEEKEKIKGLSEQQAEEQRRLGLCNRPQRSSTKSYRHIFFENIFSVFNMINAVIALSLIYVGSFKNCLFMLAVISNTLIGIIQEIRSKRVTDRLSIVSQPTVTLIRSGKRREAKTQELVKGDVIELSMGCQVPNDCTVISGQCEVNEALLTGEADALVKHRGDRLLSGSVIAAGRCLCEITAVGRENYSDSILSQIKYVKRTNSEIVLVIKRIITVLSVCIVPIGALLFLNQITQSQATVREAVESTAAALIGMIPEGLVLLSSTVFALGVVRLSRKNVLSQDLYSLEVLARTDVICLDKTGTITTGEMTFEKLIAAEGVGKERLEAAVSVFADLTQDGNSTANAIREAFHTDKPPTALSLCPFSSERKWSSVTSKDHGTVILGSQEMIFGESTLEEGVTENYRAVCVAASDEPPIGTALPENKTLLGFVLLNETVRPGVSETLEFFKRQGVEVKLISGDAPRSVRRLCSGLPVGSSCADLSQLSDEEIASEAEKTAIFGRATPKQKKLIVSALRKNGHTVAMVGDGVNDVLALKESDCSIAPAMGSAAARNVSQLVLLDSDFRSLPSVAAQGRQAINNLQNSSSLFLAKTIFSTLMAIIFIFLNREYPFDPIQMTLVSTLTIGFPSFVLSFIKNERPISGSLLRHIISNSLPAALANISSVLAAVLLSETMHLVGSEIAALCVSALAVTGLALIVKIYRPLTGVKLMVPIVSAAGFTLAFSLFGSFFGLPQIFTHIDVYMVIITISDLAVLSLLLTAFSKLPPLKIARTVNFFKER